MTQCLKSIRERMENQLNCNIKQVYVALNCQGMRSTTHLEERTFPQRITVQQELIESLKADNRDKISQDQILIDSLPLEYTMGTFSTNEAVGVMTDRDSCAIPQISFAMPAPSRPSSPVSAKPVCRLHGIRWPPIVWPT